MVRGRNIAITTVEMNSIFNEVLIFILSFLIWKMCVNPFKKNMFSIKFNKIFIRTFIDTHRKMSAGTDPCYGAFVCRPGFLFSSLYLFCV